MKRVEKKKKAFTLIELLAVIVILAIIALIVGVTIGNITDKAGKEAYKESVRGIIRSAENYMGKYLLSSHKDPVYPIVFTCDGNTCSNGTDKLDFAGDVPKSGTITLINHKTIKAEYITNGKYCVSGTKTDMQAAKSCSDIDITKPTVDGTLEGNILHLILTDNESGIASYCVTTENVSTSCTWINTTNSNVEYTLNVSGTYYVYAKDKKENVSNGKEFITGDIEKPIVTAELDGKIINIEVSDNASVVGYCVVSTNDSTGCTWNTVTNDSFGHTLTEAGTYYVFAKDSSGNISDSVEVTAGSDAFCALEIGWYKEFAYKGSVEEWEVPCDGLYQLEVWGASSTYYGGQGGYASGYKKSNSGDIFYIVCGGAGSGANSISARAGGYNGGGSSTGYNGSGSSPSMNTLGSGGGATHVATITGTLPSLSNNRDSILIVAGGGGGGTWDQYANKTRYGGSGGAIPSGSGSPFGQGKSSDSSDHGGGGGGWTGGGGSWYVGSPASGGTSYIDGVSEITYQGTTYSPSTTVGGNSGNGKAKITLIAY